MKVILITVLFFVMLQPGSSQPVANLDSQNTTAEPSWTLEIYPILAWAPIFGASVNLPSLPAGGLPGVSGGFEGTNAASGTTPVSLNGAAMAGIFFRAGRFISYFDGIYASVSADRTTPRVSISTQGTYGDLVGGVEIFDHFALTAGVRRMGLKVDAQLEDLPKIEWRPGVWDPIVGIDWRARLGRSWTTELRLSGGGFGVGSDVDLGGSFRANWRLARHFGLAMGYGVLHYQNTRTILNRDFKTKQTFNGPIFGFGIFI